MKKTTYYLLGIIILGLILRIIAAINIGYGVDDVTNPFIASNFLDSGKLEYYGQSSSLWFTLTDAVYHFIDISHFSSRLSTVVFGVLSILAIFLLTKELFKSNKIALIGAFLLAVSPFHIKFTTAESDIMLVFFILMSVYLFVKALNNENSLKYFAISGVFMGLGVITKVYPLLFIPVLVVFAAYKNNKIEKKWFNKKIVKGIFLFLVIMFFFCIPTLTHNYLLYKDKGIMDFIFTGVTGLGAEEAAQFYSWDAGWGKGNDWAGLFLGNSTALPWSKWPTFLYCLGFVLFSDYIVFILGVIGLIWCYKNKKEYFWLFALILLFPFCYLASVIPLSKHYLFILVFLIPPAAVAITNLPKIKLKHIIVIILIFQLLFLGYNARFTPTHFYGKSAVTKMIEFKDNNIENNSIIVFDSRIYRGTGHWISFDRPYFEGTQFIQIANAQSLIPGEFVVIPVYYIECVIDDCGWGYIHKQPEFNQSMESLTDWFGQNGKSIYTIDEPYREKAYYPLILEKNRNDIFTIYKANLQLKSDVLTLAKRPKNWFLYNIGYSGDDFDDYEIHSSFDNMLYKFSRGIIWISIILTGLCVFYVAWLVYKEASL